MVDFNIIIAILAGVALFLFSIDKFSHQIKRLAGKKFKKILARLTNNRIKGAAVGFGVTSVIQSSTATTLITLSLVNAGLLSLYSSLAVIIGANIGTTLTTQLIAFKLTSFAPWFIVIGFLLWFVPNKYKVIGKPILYFGMVFFSLSLVITYLGPISSDPEVINLFSLISNIYLGILAGFLFTAVVQSSSITTGLAVILVGTNLLTFDQALGVIFGANIGTTLTALIASVKMNKDAKKAALFHTAFNIISVVAILPFIVPFATFVQGMGGTIERQIANAHLIFNLTAGLIFLLLINPVYHYLLRGKKNKKFVKKKR